MGTYRFTYSGSCEYEFANGGDAAAFAEQLTSAEPSRRAAPTGLSVELVRLDYDASWLPESHQSACAAIEFARERRRSRNPVIFAFDGSRWATDGCAAIRCEPTDIRNDEIGSVCATYKRSPYFGPRSDPREVPGDGEVFRLVDVNPDYALAAKYVELVEAIWPRAVWHAPTSTADGPAQAVVDGKTVAFVMGVRR